MKNRIKNLLSGLTLKPRFKLKQGDKVIVYIDNEPNETEVIGFYCYGMHVKGMGVVPFNSGRFYGAGYNQMQCIITVKKKSHYIWALRFEWFRLHLPDKIGTKIFGF